MPSSPFSPSTSRLIRHVSAFVALGLASVACGGDSPPSLDSLDETTRNLVLFESGWQCEVGRFVVDDAAELEQLRVNRQDAHDISPAAYQAFLERLADDDDLAHIVSEETSSCLENGEPVRL